ncbi:MAG: winged helix-turn-helix transcriptional regulator [Candidatus Njordarchaeales archaeon]
MPMRGRIVRRVFEKSPKGDIWEGLVRKVLWGRTREYKLILRAHWPDSDSLKKIIEDIMRSRVITPNYIAQRYNIKVSTAKRLLEELRKAGYVKLIEDSSDASLKIYTPIKK